jgi:hypothetical protein
MLKSTFDFAVWFLLVLLRNGNVGGVFHLDNKVTWDCGGHGMGRVSGQASTV